MFLREKEDKRNAALLNAEKSLLLIIDTQEKFVGAVTGIEEVAKRICILAKAAAHLWRQSVF